MVGTDGGCPDRIRADRIRVHRIRVHRIRAHRIRAHRIQTLRRWIIRATDHVPVPPCLPPCREFLRETVREKTIQQIDTHSVRTTQNARSISAALCRFQSPCVTPFPRRRVRFRAGWTSAGSPPTGCACLGVKECWAGAGFIMGSVWFRCTTPSLYAKHLSRDLIRD